MPASGRSIWPALTVVLAAVAVVSGVVVVPVYGTINPNPFSFTTDNIFFIATGWFPQGVFVLAAGAAGIRHGMTGTASLRIAAAVAAGVGLLMALIIVGVQALGGARSDLRLQGGLAVLALALAGCAAVVALVAPRRTAGSHNPAAILALACLMAAAIIFGVREELQYWSLVPASVIVRTLVDDLLPVVGVWLIVRNRKIPVWIGAALLIVIVILTLQYLISSIAVGDAGASIAMTSVEAFFSLVSAVAAAAAAGAVRHSQPLSPSAAP